MKTAGVEGKGGGGGEGKGENWPFLFVFCEPCSIRVEIQITN